MEISIPSELEKLEAGKMVYRNGAVKDENEKIEVVMVKENKKQYSGYFAEVTQDGKRFAFAKLPEEKEKFKVLSEDINPYLQHKITALLTAK